MLEFACSSLWIGHFHDGRYYADSRDAGTLQHKDVVLVEPADSVDGNGHGLHDVLERFHRGNDRVYVSRRGVNRTAAQVIRTLLVSFERLRHRLGRNTHNPVIAHQFASQMRRHVALPHMNSLGTDGERHVHAIVNNQRDSITGGNFVRRRCKPHVLPCRLVLFAQLDNRRAALAGRLHHGQEALLGNARAVGDKVKRHIKVLAHKQILHVKVIVQDGLQTFARNIAVHGVEAAAVVDFELFVAAFPVILAAVLAFVVANASRNAGGDLRRTDFHDAVAEFLAFAARDSNAHEREEDAVSAEHLAKFLLVNVERVNLVVVDDGAQSRAAEAHLGMRILLLQVIHVERARERIAAEVRKAEESGERDAAHARHQGAFLRVEAVREYALVAQQVELFEAHLVVGFLEDGHVVHAAFVQVAVFVDIDRVDFHAHHAEILAGQLAGLADVFHAALRAAFAGEDQYFFHAAVGDDLHLVLNLLHRELHALDVVVAVEPAIDAIVFAIVRNVERREKVDVVAEVLARLDFRLRGHLFQVRGGGRRKERLEVFERAAFMFQRALHVLAGVLGVIVVLGLREDLFANVRLDDFHAGQVIHDVGAGARIGFDTVFLGERTFRKVSGIEQVVVVFSF